MIVGVDPHKLSHRDRGGPTDEHRGVVGACRCELGGLPRACSLGPPVPTAAMGGRERQGLGLSSRPMARGLRGRVRRGHGRCIPPTSTTHNQAANLQRLHQIAQQTPRSRGLGIHCPILGLFIQVVEYASIIMASGNDRVARLRVIAYKDR